MYKTICRRWYFSHILSISSTTINPCPSQAASGYDFIRSLSHFNRSKWTHGCNLMGANTHGTLLLV